jgi:heme exporter protein B
VTAATHPHGPSAWRAAAAILRKDLAIELRTRESVPAMALFSVTAFALFHFGLDRDEIAGDLAAGVLWVTLLLAAVLGVNRLFVAEREQGGADGLLLAPIDRTAVFLAKAGALLLYLLLLELVALPAFALLLLGPDLLDALPELLGVIALADVGVAAVGALVSALATETRARDLIVPLVLLPLLVPVAIAGAEATAPLLEPGAQGELARWMAILGLYDLVFVLLSVGVFDFLLED